MKTTKFSLFAVCCCVLAGCSVVDYFRPEGPPYDRELYESYNRTILNVSSSVDVLATIYKSEPAVLSQSKSVIASAGRKEEDRIIWSIMVAFDETRPTAMRKYILIADDRPSLMEDAAKRLSFDGEIVLDSKVLDEPYADEKARRIAILKQVLEDVRGDTAEVGPQNKTLDICGMLIQQSLSAVLVELDSSPALASKLSNPAGMEFRHLSFGKGRVQMLLDREVAKIKMRLGPLAKQLKEPEQEQEDSGK